MSKIKHDIPSYDTAMCIFFDEVTSGFYSLDPLFGSIIPRFPTEHAGPSRNVGGDVPLDQKMSMIEVLFEIEFGAIRNTDIEKYTSFVYELAQEKIKAVSLDFFNRINEVADATGNVIDARGKPLSLDDCNDALEKFPITFDENGEPVLPTLLMHPDMVEIVNNLKPTQEQEERRKRILAQKKEDFNAQKRTRRLS